MNEPADHRSDPSSWTTCPRCGRGLLFSPRLVADWRALRDRLLASDRPGPYRVMTAELDYGHTIGIGWAAGEGDGIYREGTPVCPCEAKEAKEAIEAAATARQAARP